MLRLPAGVGFTGLLASIWDRDWAWSDQKVLVQAGESHWWAVLLLGAGDSLCTGQVMAMTG